MPSLKHKFISTKADGTNTTEVRPTNWNDEHDLKTLSAAVYLGQDASGGGLVKELPIVATSGDDFTMWTKAAAQAAITAAAAGIKLFDTGDIIASLAAGKSGWAKCNGQSLFIGNGTSNHDLFVLLWALPDPNQPDGKWPVLPTRGASAEADWTASKSVNVPNMHGCVLGMLDGGQNRNPLLVNYGIKVGVDKLSLVTANMPTHTHTLYDPANMLVRGNLGGTGVGTPVNFDNVSDKQTGATGGDPAATPAYANPVPVNLTQPTVGVNFFIKL